MSALPSAGGGYGALHLVLPVVGCNGKVASSEFLAPNAAAAAASSGANKRKRRPAGTPDPGAEVVALSPKTLMESDRYVCEICNQGFQRDQNLQMHRRRHKVPWKLLKRPSLGTNKRVYICPERSCLHHDPAHALGDLVGIKKHYRRKHCTEKQWKCDKCSKGYAVQSDYKAHLKTCGTRGHCCDCGRVFSRVESFIEHQDTCNAVKHKATQSEGRSGRVKSSSAPHQGTDRNSTASPSQSSDTTQAMSFAHSGMSDTVARSSADHTNVAEEHSRRTQKSQAVAATPSTAAPPMPAWLTDHSRRNELDLLPSKHRVPTDHSKSQVTRCSSVNFPYPEVSCPESKSTLEPSREPSLQLSMGPYDGAEIAFSSVSPYVDTKPSFRSVETRVLVHQRQTSAGNVIIPRVESSSRSDLALSIPATALKQPRNQTMEGGPETDRAVSLSGFLMQAARRLGPDSQEENTAGLGHRQSSSRVKQQYQNMNSRTEMVANYNPCMAAGSTSSYHEDLAANMHESDAPGSRVMSRRGFINSQLESATSSVISTRQAIPDDRDVVETDHLFAAISKSEDEAFRLQKHMAVGARAEANQACEQERTDMNVAWSDLARVRRSKDEARRECDEAQRDIARAEILKREAREQLQFAAAERAYAERARDVAKRQIEISEAELARAKRLREHAQSELDKAGSSLAAISSSPAFCHSCKSAVDPNIPLRNLAETPTSPGSSTWSFLTPATDVESSDQLTRAGTGLNLWPANQLNLWPAGYRSMSASAASMAVGESPASRPGLNPRVTVGESANSRAQPDQEQNIITLKLDLDLN